MGRQYKLGWSIVVIVLSILGVLIFPPTYPQDGSVETFIKEGRKKAREEHFQEALYLFQKAVHKDPGCGECYFFLAKTFNRLGHYSKALKAFQRAEELGYIPQSFHYDLGLCYLGLKKYKKAAFHFTQDIKQNSDRAYSYYFKAIALYSQKAYREVPSLMEEAIKKGLKEVQQARYYSALSLSALEQYEEALQQFDVVITIDPESSRGEEAARLREKMRLYAPHVKKELAHPHWYARLNVGGEYDSNVISIGKDAILPSDFPHEKDWRSTVSFMGGYRLMQKPISQLWADIRYTGHLHDDLDDYDIQYLGAYLRGVYEIAPRWQAGVRGGYDHAWVGRGPYSWSILVSPHLKYKENEWASLRLEYSGRFSDYRNTVDTPDLDKDSFIHSLQLTQNVAVPTTDLTVAFGYQYSFIKSDGDDYDYDSDAVFASFWHPFLFTSRINAGVIYMMSDYDNANSRSSSGAVREDERLRFSAGLSKEIVASVTGFVSYTVIKNMSNIDDFDYKRRIFSAGVNYSF